MDDMEYNISDIKILTESLCDETETKFQKIDEEMMTMLAQHVSSLENQAELRNENPHFI